MIAAAVLLSACDQPVEAVIDAGPPPTPPAPRDESRLFVWRRLSREEIDPTVQKLQSGIRFPELAGSGFPLDERLGGFDTDPQLLQFSSAHLHALEWYAGELAEAIAASDALHALGGDVCGGEDAAACLRAVLSEAATLLLRRPRRAFASCGGQSCWPRWRACTATRRGWSACFTAT